jgi:hypothetical protein
MARKKVLRQEWMTDEGYRVSISLDKAQLEGTIADLKERDRGEPQGEAKEVELDDEDNTSYALLEMVDGGTIFLNKDEEDIIIYE